MKIMRFDFYVVFIFNFFNYLNTEIHLYMDNQTLCNEDFIDLENVQTGRIYSHLDYHNKYFYFSDHHCSITLRTNRRIWMSVEYFQSNSSVAFPRCTEAKYAGIDDRLQIIDGYKTGSILRIICGKDADQRFDHTPLILKSSTFTIDWQTKSQSFGFELKFVLYDLAIDGQCVKNTSQFLCDNKRCIDRSLICSEDDYCGDGSQSCPKGHWKHQRINWPMMFILLAAVCSIFVIICTCTLKTCRGKRKNKQCGGGL